MSGYKAFSTSSTCAKSCSDGLEPHVQHGNRRMQRRRPISEGSARREEEPEPLYATDYTPLSTLARERPALTLTRVRSLLLQFNEPVEDEIYRDVSARPSLTPVRFLHYADDTGTVRQ